MQIENIELARLKPSPTNPRKRFDEAQLKDLAESIRTQGIVSPLIVRAIPVEPITDGVMTPEMTAELTRQMFEIIAGERRYRAAQRAELAQAPCIVRELSDNDALEIQLVENLQRSDLTDFEEAESFAAMLKLKDEAGKARYTVNDLAARIGRSADTIYRKLKLLNAPPLMREALEKGEVSPSIVALVGRIPSEKARARAAEQILKPQFQLTPLTVIQTTELIATEYNVSLQRAPFNPNDPKLVPEAGACTTCPKRAGNNPDCAGLRPDTCTDVECFRAKERAEWLAWQQETSTKDGLVEALSPEASRKALALGTNVRLNSVPPADVLAVKDGAPVETELTWAKLTKDRGLKCVVARDADLREVTLVDIHQAIAAAKLNGHEALFRDLSKPKPKLKDADEAKNDWAEKEKARDKKTADTRQVAEEIFRRIIAAAAFDWKPAQLAAVIKVVGKHGVDAESTWERRGFKSEKHEDAALAAMNDSGLKRYLLEMALGNMVDYEGDLRPQVATLCAAFGVKWKEIDREVRKDLAAKAKPATAAATQKAARPNGHPKKKSPALGAATAKKLGKLVAKSKAAAKAVAKEKGGKK